MSLPSTHVLHSRHSLLQFVKQLLEKGNSVVATARAPSKATELHKLAEKHSNLMLTEVDVTSMDSIKVRARVGLPLHTVTTSHCLV